MIAWLAVTVATSAPSPGLSQEYGKAERGEPGDALIQEHLRRLAEGFPDRFLHDVKSADDWRGRRERYRREYLYMLGLWPLPPRSPLEARVTGTFEGDGFVVEKLHYQSRPRLYVTANLYRPPNVPPGKRLPAVLYVCGHSGRGRNGVKTAFQSHGMWFARHGYICLVVDTLQLGEIAATHHGTYRYGRWWWHSRGYTPAGVECWNGVRGIDYLLERPDVDVDRIAVTGISGGGAATFWVAAADDRVKVAVPVSGMADLPSYVSNRVINGHCDCMFLHNTFEWPWTRIAALVAPRPLLFVNSDRDSIFPMDANERISNRLERLYSLFGAGDLVDSVVSVGGHAYREDIRRAAYRFINTHLKGDAAPVEDSEVDLVTGRGAGARHPIPPEDLRVFPTDADIPADELNTTIDRHFVPTARVALPGPGEFPEWKETLLAELRRVSFRSLPWQPAHPVSSSPGPGLRLLVEGSFPVDLVPVGTARGDVEAGAATRLVVSSGDDAADLELLREMAPGSGAAYLCDPRGSLRTRWTRRDPPNTIERSHVLLGRTVDGDRVRDVAAAAAHLKSRHSAPVHVAGKGAAGILAAYAALWESSIGEVTLISPPASHMEDGAPRILNVLRVCDIPEILGLLAPRKLRLVDAPEGLAARVRGIYAARGAEGHLLVR
ncbi:MAG: prolyl oligopeptidase family serine peptidase [Planctomycetota bacterium]|nr:prolyl oligopeptidase family serine peptidase [Planctomycetota bacterium]